VSYSGGDGLTGRVGGTTPGFTGVSEARHGFILDPGACKYQSIKCPCRGSRYGGGEPVRSSSEAEPHPRGRLALKQGGDSLVRCRAPRAKRSSARGWLGRLFWWAAGATSVVGPTTGPSFILSVFKVCFVFCFSESKWVSPVSLGTLMAVLDN
jgi:hypothetical protein